MEDNKKRFCVKCGSPLLEGAKFCTKCGHLINEQGVTGITSESDKTKGKKGSVVLLCIFVVLLVLAFVVWGLVFADMSGVFQHEKEEIAEETETDTEQTEATDVGKEDEDPEETEMPQTDEMVDETAAEEGISTEDAILSEQTLNDCRQAYKSFLEGYEMEFEERFGLAYIDGDDIPELLIFQGDAHAHGAQIYSFYENAVVYAGTMGGYGGFHYSEKNNLMVYSDGHMGVFYENYNRLENGVITEYESLYGEEVIDPDTFEIIGYSYYINDVKVTEEEYFEKSEELSAGLELTGRYYETSYPITQTFIDQVFSDEKNWMKKEQYIDVEKEIEQIREWYYETQNNINNYEEGQYGEFCAYRSSYLVDKIVTTVGNYTHEYYYRYGTLYFVFVYDGSEEYRYYYKNGLLIRYVNPQGETFDWGNLDEFEETGEEIEEYASDAYWACVGD